MQIAGLLPRTLKGSVKRWGNILHCTAGCNMLCGARGGTQYIHQHCPWAVSHGEKAPCSAPLGLWGADGAGECQTKTTKKEVRRERRNRGMGLPSPLTHRLLLQAAQDSSESSSCHTVPRASIQAPLLLPSLEAPHHLPVCFWTWELVCLFIHSIACLNNSTKPSGPVVINSADTSSR